MLLLDRGRLLASNMHYSYYPFDYFLRAQQAFGARAIEFWGGTPHLLLDEVSCGDCEGVRRAAEAYGLSIASFMPESLRYPYPLCAWDEAVFQKALAYYRQALCAAGALGAKYMPLYIVGGASDEAGEAEMERAVRALHSLAPHAQESGVVIAVAAACPNEGGLFTSLASVKALLAAVAHKNVQAALDICAMGAARETPRQWMEAFGEALCYVFLADGRPEGRMAWGDGCMSLDAIIEALDEGMYTGFVSLALRAHLYCLDPVKADEQVLRALRPYIAGGGVR